MFKWFWTKFLLGDPETLLELDLSLVGSDRAKLQ